MSRRLTLRKRTGLELFRRRQAERIADHKLHTLFWEYAALQPALPSLRQRLPELLRAARHARLGLLPHARHADHAHVDTHRVRVILSGGEVLVRPDLDRIGLQLDRREYP